MNGNGCPTSTQPHPPRDQPRIVVSSRERDANGLQLFSTPMDNLVAGRAAADSITATGDGALQIQYIRALLAKAVEQQKAGADSQGRVYSRSSGSRAAAQRRQTPSTARHQSHCSSNTDPRTRHSPPTTPGRRPTSSPLTGNPSTPAPTSSTTKAGAHASPTTCDIP